MKLIKPSYEILSDTDDVFKNIEIAGRTCYKSEDKITENSSRHFVQMLINRGHTAMLEHGTVYLQYRWDGSVCQECNQINSNNILDFYYPNQYSKVNRDGNNIYITTNYRVLIENNRLNDLQYQCKPTEHHEKRISVKFVCDRGISHELVRHRVFSFAQESTRYCNYSKDKFDNQLTFIIPLWIKEEDINTNTLIGPEQTWYNRMLQSELCYNELIDTNWTPQEARSILPNSLKTEIVVTGFASDWKGFYDEEMKPHGMFPLRVDKAAHPQMRELMIPLQEELKEKLPEIFGK